MVGRLGRGMIGGFFVRTVMRSSNYYFNKKIYGHISKWSGGRYETRGI